MKSEINDLKAVRRQNQIRVGPIPLQRPWKWLPVKEPQAGIIRVVKSVEEERNVTIVSLVVVLDMLFASVLEEGIWAVVVWENASDYSGGTQNSRQ